MFVTQISVYLENIKGTLRKVTSLLKENNIDVLALSIADTSSFGIVRFIVKEKDIDKAISLLQEKGCSTRKNRVICTCLPNEPGGLDNVLSIVEDAGLSVEYLYSFNYSANGKALIIFRLSDQEAGMELLKNNGVELLVQNDLNKL